MEDARSWRTHGRGCERQPPRASIPHNDPPVFAVAAVAPRPCTVRPTGSQTRALVGWRQHAAAEHGTRMDIRIKKFDVTMSVKSKGIEFEVRSPDGDQHLGDCYLTMSGVIWCPGRTTKQNGVKITWEDLTTVLATEDNKRTAVRAARRA